MNRAILSHQSRIDNLFIRAAAISDTTEKSHWAKYLCVLSSGYIEASLREILTEYCSNRSSLQIQRFADKQIKRITNCKNSRIVEILDAFDNNWAITYQDEIKVLGVIEEEIKDSIDSLVSNRHDIAHGKNTGISFVRVKNYYENAKKAIGVIDAIVA